MRKYQNCWILLSLKPRRVIRMRAPITVTRAELCRIQQWLAFQFCVEPELIDTFNETNQTAEN